MGGADIVIRVADEYGVHCVSPDDAQRLFDRLHEALRVGKAVEMDFGGVDTIATVFLNVALGKLFGQFEAEAIERQLRWRNVADVDERLIRLVIRNAKAHYKMTPEAREREAQMLSKALGTP